MSTITNLPKQDAKIPRVLQRVGITKASRIISSLQGSIWRASMSVATGNTSETPSLQPVVVKVANRYLQQHALAQVDGKYIKVDEDILMEAALMKKLSQCADCPSSIVKFIQLFESKTDYYLVMEDGGGSLFEFTVQAQKFMLAGKITVAHWKKVVQVIFQQMVQAVAYLHAKGICHLDVSLENFLINDVAVELTTDDKVEFVLDDIRVKLCDFGLAESFGRTFVCKKFCGKPGYKSPEVVAKKDVFDARKNDIWCLAVCLFMMSVGTAPWKTASKSDEGFVCMTNGFMKGVLKSWDVLHLVNDDLLDLFESVFQCETDRISMDEMRAHAWWKNAN